MRPSSSLPSIRTPRSQIRQVSSSSSLRLSQAGSGASSTAFIVAEIRDSTLKPLFRGAQESGKLGFECTVPNLAAHVDPVAIAIDHPAGGQAAEGAGGSAVIGVGAKLLLFSRQKLRDARISRAEAELAIKPEGAGFDGFLVVEAELVGIDGEERDTEQLVKQPQKARVEPGGLAFAKSVVEVEADLHLLRIGERFDVADGDGVLEDEAGVIGAHW